MGHRLGVFRGHVGADALRGAGTEGMHGADSHRGYTEEEELVHCGGCDCVKLGRECFRNISLGS